MKERAHFLVTGRVQGVGYRYSTCIEARRLGLTGWVRNLPDSRVEIMAEGEGDAIRSLLAWCRRGPCMASVHDVKSQFLECRGRFDVFDITT